VSREEVVTPGTERVKRNHCGSAHVVRVVLLGLLGVAVVVMKGKETRKREEKKLT